MTTLGTGLTPNDLKPIRLSELTLDAPLPGSLYNEFGHILVTGGKPVREDDLDRLGRYLLHTGPDWPCDATPSDKPTSTPARVMDDLADQQGDSEANRDERRTHQRHQWNVTLTLELVEKVRGCLVRRRVNVNTQDISRTGFGFVYNQYVYPGTEVVVRVQALPAKPVLNGVVRNCINVGSVKHRVGVEFKTDAKPRRG